MSNPTIQSSDLRTAIRAVKRAISTDDTRPHLACMRLDVTPTMLTTSATNGWWLARYTHAGTYGGSASLLVQRDSAIALARWLRPRRVQEDTCDYCGAPEEHWSDPPPCMVDAATGIVTHERGPGDRGRFALDIYKGSAAPPDLDKVIPPETTEAFPGHIATNLLRHISRSFNAYGRHALQFRGTGLEEAIRISALPIAHDDDRSLLVICVPVKSAT